MPRDESDLAERWQRGDADAFEAIVRQWQAPIGRFLTRLVGSPEDVQDLVQEVFLRVYQARGRYRENGAFRVWLYQIAPMRPATRHDAIGKALIPLSTAKWICGNSPQRPNPNTTNWRMPSNVPSQNCPMRSARCSFSGIMKS